MAGEQGASQLNPDQVAAYLQATGWQRLRRYASTWIWLRTVAERNLHVLLPDGTGFSDYPQRMAQLLATVAEAERRDQSDVLRDLREPLTDVHQIRTMPNSPSGTSPIEDATRAVKGIRDLWKTAATWLLLDRPLSGVLPSQTPKEVAGFLDQVRLGLPAAGSYILRVETPITNEIVRSREITRTIYQLVSAAHKGAVASAQAGNPRPFLHQIGEGVTAQLCEALAELGGKSRSPFEFGVDWSWQAPVDVVTPTVYFTADHVTALYRGKTLLRQYGTTVDAVIVGVPETLTRKQIEQIGQVIFTDARVLLEDQAISNRWVKVTLGPEQYEQARQAHGPKLPLRISGRLTMTGRQWELTDITDLTVMDRPH